MSAGLISLLTFFLGLVLGHWLAIGRDKRKEFNEASTPIRDWLLRVKDSPTPYDGWPTEQEFDRFMSYLRPWQRASFTKHLASYRKLHQSEQLQDSAGQVSYRSAEEIRNELSALFRYTRRM